MKKSFLSLLALSAALFVSVGHAHAQFPTIYVAESNGFETNLAAAFQKKQVPVTLVSREEDARYILRPGTVEIHKETGFSKFARCAFAYCIGIEDSGEVGVVLVDRGSGRVVWAYEVAKQRATKNR